MREIKHIIFSTTTNQLCCYHFATLSKGKQPSFAARENKNERLIEIERERMRLYLYSNA